MAFLAMGSLPPESDGTDQEQRTPKTTVTLVSDNQCWISIIGPSSLKPQKLKKATLQLSKGEYRIYGRRYGYKMTTLLLKIQDGFEYDPIRIVCKKRGEEIEPDWDAMIPIKGRKNLQ
ncbi:hypothetical protein VDG1235_4860 [Verrucomicrobiia bacterium DG1235]|nr:hypothetical protein VDG1235_4860 [Verrucomicrobiae bacterium DG1235]